MAGELEDAAALWPLSAAPHAVDAAAVVRALGLGSGGRAGLPRTVGIMIATVDGRAALSGRSVGLGSPADRALLRTLRARADAILVGSGTLAAERYGGLLDPWQRDQRVAAGRPPHPLVVTVSRRLDLDRGAIPVLDEPGTQTLIFTEGPGWEPAGGVTTIALAPGTLTLRGVLEHLAAERGVTSVACEGGPTMLAHLVAEDCLDDLLLTVAPVLSGESGHAPAITAGPLATPARLTLADVHRAGDHAFLHYVRAGAPARP